MAKESSLREIEGVLERTLEKALAKGDLNKAARAMGIEHIALQRKQLNSGLDEDGKRIKPLSRLTKKAKTRFVKGDEINFFARRKSMKKRGKEYAKSTLEGYKYLKTKTEFAAKNVPNFGRWTGQTMASYAIKNVSGAVKNGKIILNYTFYISNKYSDKIYKYLREKFGRKYALCLNKTTTGKKNMSALIKAASKVLFPKANLSSGRINEK